MPPMSEVRKIVEARRAKAAKAKAAAAKPAPKPEAKG